MLLVIKTSNVSTVHTCMIAVWTRSGGQVGGLEEDVERRNRLDANDRPCDDMITVRCKLPTIRRIAGWHADASVCISMGGL